MKRGAAFSLVLFVVFGVLISIPGWSDGSSSGGESYEPTRITNYAADFTIARNGDLSATEKLTVDFPTPRHGIFRYFDTHDPTAPHARRIPEAITVSQDGSPATTDLSWHNHRRERIVKIGDADRELTGQHTYVISYRIPGVLEKGTDGARTQLYWNLIPGGWSQAIDKATLKLRLPATATKVQCAVGGDIDEGCSPLSGNDHMTITTGALSPRTPVTVKVGLDMATPPAGRTLPWTGSWDAVLGRSVTGPIVVLVLAVVAALVAWLLVRRTRENEPGFPLQYAPPDGIGPAQAEYLRNESTERTSYVASMLYAAEKGAVELKQEDGDWTITDTGRGWQGIDKVSQEVYRLIEHPKGSFTASKNDVTSGQRLVNLSGEFASATRKWGTDSGNLATIPGIRAGAAFAGVALFVAGAGLVFLHSFIPTIWIAIPAAYGAIGVRLMGRGAGTRRTAQGRELWSRVSGFRRVLSTASSEARFDFAGKHELYTAYLPWAVAFGCADTWAEKFRIETGSEPPTPSYVTGFTAGAFAGDVATSMVSSFENTVSSSISAYEATQSSSSSGGGGGFSGGGGGGGGGGGSW